MGDAKIPERDRVEELRRRYCQGMRIRLNKTMDDPYHPVPAGTMGSVENVDDMGTIHMRWDNGQSLGLIEGVDEFEVCCDVEKGENVMSADENGKKKSIDEQIEDAEKLRDQKEEEKKEEKQKSGFGFEI